LVFFGKSGVTCVIIDLMYKRITTTRKMRLREIPASYAFTITTEDVV
jgi:hypothetical protein